MRQHGVNFGNAAGNVAGDQNPPYVVKLLLNQGYGEFIERTRAGNIVTMKVFFPTVANATSFPLWPIPNDPNNNLNPAAMRVLEATYTTQTGGQNAGYEYNVDLVSAQRFKFLSGDYTRRLSWFGPRVLYATRLYRRSQLDVLPGCATTGDIMSLTIVPYVALAPAGLTCANGGIMANDADVPLIPVQYHMALVDFVVLQAGDAINKGAQVQAAQQRWEAAIAEAVDEGGTEDGGDPQNVIDTWRTPVLRDGAFALN